MEKHITVIVEVIDRRGISRVRDDIAVSSTVVVVAEQCDNGHGEEQWLLITTAAAESNR